MPVHIREENNTIRIAAVRYGLVLDCERGVGEVLDRSGAAFFSFPLDVKVTTRDMGDSQIPLPLRATVDTDRVELVGRRTNLWTWQKLSFQFTDDHFTVAYSAVAAKSLRVSDCVCFFRVDRGMSLQHIYQGFSPAPTAGRNGEEGLYSFTPSATAYSFFSPSPLNIGLGFAHGWVGLGLIDLPNGEGISLGESWGLEVDAPAGHVLTGTGEQYAAPRIAVTFPANEWEGISEYRRVLVEMGMVDTTPIEERNLPGWWKRPAYCTYGDQIVEMQPYWLTDWHWGADGFTDEWARNAIERTERRLGYRDFTVILDAFWTKRWDGDPNPTDRFPDLRGFIDWCHDRGHKVLLWYPPLVTSLLEGAGSDARRFGVLPPGTDLDAEKVPIDITSPDFPAYAQHLARVFFGDGPGELDADGLKLDFIGLMPRPRDTRYQNPTAGMGLRSLHRWLTIFGEAARSVKSDVHLNWSAADPHFEGMFSSNRTHDTHFSTVEFERRSRISALAMPNTMINFDGCLMRDVWADVCYLPAALYGTASLYYSNKFHGNVEIPDEQLEVLGKLFALSARRPWGRPIFLSYGNWQLESEGCIVGETVDSKALVMFHDEHSGSIFSMVNERISLPLHGREVLEVSPKPADLDISDGAISASWERGVVYDLRVEDEMSAATILTASEAVNV